MNEHHSSQHPMLLSKSTKRCKKRQEFWNGTLVDDYNFLMSEELICRCKGSFGEAFTSLNDLAVYHVSYNEFEKQYIELSDWCEKISQIIKQISSNTLTCYFRQNYYEELYEQGLMRLRMFKQYSDKLIERFPDLKLVIKDKMKIIYQLWNQLEARFIDYLDEDFDRIIEDLHNELFLFEEWIIEIEVELWKFNSIRTDKISLEDFQWNLQQLTKLQDEIKSKNSRVSSVIEICERLRNDYQQQMEQVPFDYASDLENRWHQIWINSVEIQCKLEEKLKILKHTTSLILIDEDDVIPFYSNEYEKIPIISSHSSINNLNSSISNRKRSRSSCMNQTICSISTSFNFERKMAKSKRHMSLNLLPNLSPSIFYYSLTNINDYDEQQILTKKQKKTLSKLDVGYASEDDYDEKNQIQPIYKIKKSQSDYTIELKTNSISSSLTHSLPLFEHDQFLPEWWRHSITSAYDTCSNPDIDLSIEETKKAITKPSLLMYSKKYTKFKRNTKLKSIISYRKLPNLASNSYDASAEYTDPEQSENDVDILSSDFTSSSPIHHYQNSESFFYNRYTTTTTGYSSDIELEITTMPSETEEQQLPHLGRVSQMNINALTLPSLTVSEEIELLNNDKIEGSEPCWDGYQNPLFYPLNSQDIDSIETTLKWEDQFLEMDQPYNSSSDDEVHLLQNIAGSSSSLIRSVSNKQIVDSDSDLDDFNYVINETERQLIKARQSLEKKKRQQSLRLISSDRNQRKYDEILRTCETNIHCLQQILKNIHRSKNSHLNSTRAIEQLQTYLFSWHDMRQQINDDRTLSRHLLHISQEIIKLRLRLDEECSHINTSFNHSLLDNTSLNKLKQQISYEIQSDKDNRQKLSSFYTDIHQAEEHLNEYRLAHPDGPSSYNIDEHLHSCYRTLEQLTHKMDSYQNQLRSFLTMIDNLLPIETEIEQKLTSTDYPIDFQELQTLLDNYEEMIPMNNFYLILKTHCEYKLDIYRKIFNDLIRKQEKHVSFDGSINFNNNNSTTINSSTSSSSASSTPQQPHHIRNSNENYRTKKSVLNKYRQTQTRDIDQNYATSDTSNKRSTTSSYISDDYKVLYIETVIEVAKPVFYERTTDTLSTNTTNTEYHHHHIPHCTTSTQRPLTSNKTEYFMNIANNNHHHADDSLITANNNHRAEDSLDDDSSQEQNESENPSASVIRYQLTKDHSTRQPDSGVDLDQTSSSSTLCNHRTAKNNKNRSLFPIATSTIFDKSSQSTLFRRLQQSQLENENHVLKLPPRRTQSSPNLIHVKPVNTYWNRLQQKWLRSLLIGLVILVLLFLTYLFQLDTCSRTTMIRSVCQKIICIESKGLPTM